MTEFSAYYNSLNPEIQQRYRDKIKEIGDIDPYMIKKSEWSTDFDKLPAFFFCVQCTWPYSFD